jgi:hypothetical protein
MNRAELIGGPWAGEITMSSVGHVNGSVIEVQPPMDDHGRPLMAHAVYRFKDGAFYWVDSSIKPLPTKECPTCKGRGRIRA